MHSKLSLISDLYLEWAEKILVVLFFMMLPLAPPHRTSIIMIVLAALSIFKVAASRQSLLPLKSYLPMIILFIALLIGLIRTEDMKKGMSIIEKSLSFIAVPVIFLGLFRNNKLIKSGYYLKAFVVSIITASLVYLILAVYRSIIFANGQFTFEPTYRKITEYNDLILNHFFYSDLVVFSHTTYLAMYVCFSLLILLYLNNKGGPKIIYTTAILFLSLMIYLISSKAGFLVAGVIFLSFIITRLRKRPIYIVLIIVSVGLVTPLMIKNNQRFAKMKEAIYNNGDITLKQSYRYATWNHSIKVIRDNLWLGVGVGDSQNELIKSYKTDKSVFRHQHAFNSHNQYLDFTIKLGISGFLLLAYLLIYPFYIKNLQTDRYLLRGFIFIIGFNFIFENMLSLFHGVAFFSFFYCYFISYYNSSKADETNRSRPEVR